MMPCILEPMEWNQSMDNAIDVAYPRKGDKDSKSATMAKDQRIAAAALLQAHQHHHHHPSRQRTCVSSRGGWVMDWAYRTLTVTMANPFFYGALSLSNWCRTQAQDSVWCSRVLWWKKNCLMAHEDADSGFTLHYPSLFRLLYPRLMSFHCWRARARSSLGF